MAKEKKSATAEDAKLEATLDELLGTASTEQQPADPPADLPIDPNETIKIVEALPEVTGVAPAFHEPTADELKEFPPPPPLITPLSAPLSAPLAMDDKSTNGRAIMGTRTDPPKVVETRPEPPPPGPAFDDLPEKTKAEMRAGRKAIGGDVNDGSLSDAVLRQAPDRPVTPVVPHARDARPADVEPSKLSERTRLEIQAGRDLLARKKADYKAVLDKVAGNNAKKLEDGAPADASDLDYPRG